MALWLYTIQQYEVLFTNFSTNFTAHALKMRRIEQFKFESMVRALKGNLHIRETFIAGGERNGCEMMVVRLFLHHIKRCLSYAATSASAFV